MVELQWVFLISYVMMILQGSVSLIKLYCSDKGTDAFEILTLFQMIFNFFMLSCYYTAHWKFAWKYWLVSKLMVDPGSFKKHVHNTINIAMRTVIALVAAVCCL